MRILLDTDPAMGSAGGDPEDSFAILLLNEFEEAQSAVDVILGITEGGEKRSADIAIEAILDDDDGIGAEIEEFTELSGILHE